MAWFRLLRCIFEQFLCIFVDGELTHADFDRMIDELDSIEVVYLQKII
jgi:hypothetical protein